MERCPGLCHRREKIGRGIASLSAAAAESAAWIAHGVADPNDDAVELREAASFDNEDDDDDDDNNDE